MADYRKVQSKIIKQSFVLYFFKLYLHLEIQLKGAVFDLVFRKVLLCVLGGRCETFRFVDGDVLGVIPMYHLLELPHVVTLVRYF